MNSKPIIDICCGGRMFRFDKSNPLVHFMDIRTMEKGSIIARPSFSIEPDEVGDFRDIKSEDSKYKIVVMDPPHLRSLGDTSWMAKKYGKISDNRKEDMLKGFNEAMRILQKDGILIFKRNESEISVSEIIKLFPKQPMIGQRTGKNNKTIRLIYLKE